ncbi:MAG: DUF4912 domain-containing protein [Phormidesmis sp.]
MRANRSTLAQLCLLTALAVPVQRAAATPHPVRLQVDNSLLASINPPILLAQTEGSPAPTATSPEGLTARTEDGAVIIEDETGSPVAGPLEETGGAVTALAFSEDGQTLATGADTGKVRFWTVAEGEPQGAAFDAVPDGSAVTELAFDGNDKLSVASQGQRGLWGLNGLPFGETAAADGIVVTDGVDEGASPAWLLIPLLGLIGAGFWLFGRRRRPDEPEPIRQTAPTATVPPPETDVESDREVSNRAQSVISTDRVTDESRVIPATNAPAAESLLFPPAGMAASTLPEYESTDLESPDLEGTNLDLSASETLGGADGDMAIAAASFESAPAPENDETDDIWDDNLDLTLDDEPLSTESAADAEPVLPEPILSEMPEPMTPDPVVSEIADAGIAEPIVTSAPAIPDPAIAGSAVTGAAVSDMADFWAIGAETIPPGEEVEADSSTSRATGNDFSNLDIIEPTRDTVIAETETVLDIEPTRETIIGDRAVIFKGSIANSPTTGDPRPVSRSTAELDLTTVDEGLSELPDGYGDSRIVLLPRDPKWAYAYWDISNEHKQELRNQGGQRLMLRLYDVTDIDQQHQSPHSMHQQECHEMARSWYVEVPVSDRDYTIEIGYFTADDRWLLLTRSAPVRVPPIYPSDWVKDQLLTIGWEESLVDRTVSSLGRPDAKTDDVTVTELPPAYSELMALSQDQAVTRVAGSLFGSMHQVLPEGMALGPNMSGLNVSGLNMSGIGGASMPPARPRQFWLVAEAELIVYGATEPDATLTVGDQEIPLNPDGTFRFHVAFPDSQIDYPIQAVAADGEQSRSIHLNFERQTPERNTNTKAEAEDEWF